MFQLVERIWLRPRGGRAAHREASAAARERGSAASLRRILGDEPAGSPGLVRAADLTTKAATSAPTAGRVMYAGLRVRCRVIRSPGCGISPAELES